MDIEKQKLKNIKEKAEVLYKNIGKVKCPYFDSSGNSEVVFNTKGLEHLKFKSQGRMRSSVDQYVRLTLLPLAPKILEKSHTLQEIFETQCFERQKINSRWERRMVKVTYFGFVAIVKGARIKIIVKEIAGGNKFFWSLIPFWRVNQKYSGNKKILHAGDMEDD